MNVRWNIRSLGIPLCDDESVDCFASAKKGKQSKAGNSSSLARCSPLKGGRNSWALPQCYLARLQNSSSSSSKQVEQVN